MVLKREAKCNYQPRSALEMQHRPTVFWIDSQASASEHHPMWEHLQQIKLYGQAIPVVSPTELYFSTIAEQAMQDPSGKLCVDGSASKSELDLHSYRRILVPPGVEADNFKQPLRTRKYYLRSLCGMVDTTSSELLRTLSHLVAIYEAVHSQSRTDQPSDSQWAIIANDDARFMLDIDWNAFLKDFPMLGPANTNGPRTTPAVLLLTNPHVGLSKVLWWNRINNYTLYNHWAGFNTPANLGSALHKPNLLNDRMETLEYLQTVTTLISNSDVATAYVINKKLLSTIIDKFITRYKKSSLGLKDNENERIYVIDLLTSVEEHDLQINHFPDAAKKAIYSPKGLNVASVLFSMKPLDTYMLMFPAVVFDIEFRHCGGNSTCLQVASGSTSAITSSDKNLRMMMANDFSSHRVLRTFTNNLLEGSARLPNYMRPGCSTLLNLDPPFKHAKHKAPKGKS